MFNKANITSANLFPWDDYKSKPPEEAAASIYANVETSSGKITGWYWTSIWTKRVTSYSIRFLAFSCLIAGTALPILAGMKQETAERLSYTQYAVALLAIAGLLQVADKVFGWSSGWIRYITTATAMENLKRTFELEWAKYLIEKTAPLDQTDVKNLFDLARGLEQELLKLQAEETGKWANEFNAGITLLDSLIKTQREETDKKLDELRTTIATHKDTIKAEEKSKQPGSMEVSFAFKDTPVELKISVDKESPVTFVGHSWTKMNLPPGQHVLIVQVSGQASQHIEKIVNVPAGDVGRVDIKILS